MRSRALIGFAVAVAGGLAIGYTLRASQLAPKEPERPPTSATAGRAFIEQPGSGSSRRWRRGTARPLPAVGSRSALAHVFTKDAVTSASTDSLFSTTAAINLLERRALMRVVASDDDRGLVNCWDPGEWPDQVSVEIHVVSAPDVVRLADLRISAPGVPSSIAPCVSALVQDLVLPAKATPFMSGEGWLSQLVSLDHAD